MKIGTKLDILLQLFLITIAGVLLTYNITRPLVDNDEAAYAKVITDTIHSGDIVSMTLSGKPWFEKPPLYFWIDMPFVKILGLNEVAFRLPAILFSLLCLWFVYLIVKKETNDPISAAVSFLALLTIPFFYFYAKELRLDSAVVFTILAALYVWLLRNDYKRILILLFPIIAIGFLFKNVIALLAILAILIYAFTRHDWKWLKDKYLWFGLPIAIIIWLPWHLIETFRFGAAFWDQYMGYQVFNRATSQITGSGNFFDYIESFWQYCALWFIGILILIGIYVGMLFESTNRSKLLRAAAPSLITALGFLLLFSLAHTHLTPYLMPVFVFLALFIGMLYHELSQRLARTDFIDIPKILFALFIFVGFAYTLAPQFEPLQVYTNDEVQIGLIYKISDSETPAPLYSLDWLSHDTINYYGATSIIQVDPYAIKGPLIKGPFYIVTDLTAGEYLFYDDSSGVIQPRYPNLKLLYTGNELLLAYSSTNLQLPPLIIQKPSQ